MKKKIIASILIASLSIMQLPIINAQNNENAVNDYYAEEDISDVKERDKTDRFIVKYKNTSKTNKDELEDVSYKVLKKIRKENKEKSNKEAERKNEHSQKKDEKKERFFDGKKEVIVDKNSDYLSQNIDIIETYDEINAEEFVSQMTENLGDDIEYIQPDYEFNLSAVNDEQTNGNLSVLNQENKITINTNEIALEDDILNDNLSDNEEIVVAVIDTTIDYEHEALIDSIYTNPQEIADGIDNDENGYIDDIIGWDFINSTDISKSEITSNHGTHVSGLITADGIGAGTNAKILPLNVFNDGIAYTSDIIAAIEYAEQAGAQIVNCSWGSTTNNPALEEAISNSDMLFVCAVGNSGINIDETPVYPASYDLDNIISVGASNDRDYLAYFSDYGYNIDIAANGYKVQSTIVNNNYGTMMGASMSAAYVSGVAALVYSNSAVDTKNLILDTSDKISTLTDKINTGRRINCENAVLGIINDEIIENTNINYDEEHYQQMIENSDEYELFDLDPEPAQIYAGSNHSLVVDNWGLVKSYGDNTYNQLGSKNSSTDYVYNETVKGLDFVEKASTFANHNLALIDGTVYAWGQNDRYQLGHTSGDSNATPTQVKFFNSDGTIPTIIDISAGGWFSLALDSDGNVWAWGDNTYGQIATGYTGSRFSTPRIIMSGVEKISAGKYHALAIKDGSVYGWGRSANEYTLGETAAYSQTTPIQITGLTGDILDIEAGDRCSFFITSDGVYALGANENGQIGNGTTTDIKVPTLLNISSVQEIESNGTTMFVTTNGDVYACGQNTYGQLGQGYSNTRYVEPTKIPGDNYDKISTGGFHNLLFKCNEEYPVDQWYDRNATVYAIGCNENGQCIQTAGANITYPTSVMEVENTEDTGPFAWDSNHLRPIDATYVVQYDADKYMNFYNESVLKVNYTERESDSNAWGEYGYLKFDVSDIPKERISSAKLHLYVENEGDMRESVRTIGVYDTYVNDWDGQTMTWDEGRVGSRTLLDTFTVTATGHMIEDVGWHEVDITDYLKYNCIDNELSLMLKSVSTQAYETTITSGIYNESFTFEDMHQNKNIPVLEIECVPENNVAFRITSYNASKDTYVAQRTPNNTVDFSDDEYLRVNYTDSENGNNRYGNYSYIDFEIPEVNSNLIASAKLWIYVDENSDIRNSTRTIGVFKPASDWILPMTWESARVASLGDAISSFTVSGNGYYITDPGWRCVDVTDYVKNLESDSAQFMLKVTQGSAHTVLLRSMEYTDEATRPRLIVTNKKVQSKLINCTEGDFISIPITVSNVTNLNDIEFFVEFNSDDFEIVSTNENTDNVEITKLTTTEVAFKSNQSIDAGQVWSGIVNCIKLKAKRTGNLEITSYAG